MSWIRRVVTAALISVLVQGSACQAQPNGRAIQPAADVNQPKLRGLDDTEALTSLDALKIETAKTSGTIFVDPQQVLVKPPILSALISVDRRLSPFSLDATTERDISLPVALQAALSNNLDIKISATDLNTQKWVYYGALSNFLPSLNNDITYQGFYGRYAGAAGTILPIKGPTINMTPAFQWYLFKGGGTIFNAVQNKHLYKASKYALTGTTTDVLLQATKLYYDLVENDVLLQIRVKALQTSEGLVLRNEDLYENGVVTKLDVLRARTQRSRDRQALIAQQIARRQSAVNLATALNWDSGVDLAIRDRLVSKTRLVDDTLSAADLLKAAIDHRPELKKFDELRLAAKAAIKVAASKFSPTLAVNGAFTGSGAKVRRTDSASQNVPLSGSVSGSGAAGIPLGGSTSGSSTARTFETRGLFIIGFDLNWVLGGMGLTQLTNLQANRWQARKAQLDFVQALTRVYQQVRDDYLASISAENLIAETTDEVDSSDEALRIAIERLENGVGTDLDVVFAQRDYTSALISKAQAIVKFNVAQAQLLHDTGLITAGTLTPPGPISLAPGPISLTPCRGLAR